MVHMPKKSKSKEKTYRVRLTSPRTTIGPWTRDLRSGETFTEDLPENVLAALTEGANPLIEEIDVDDTEHDEDVQAIADQAAADVADLSPVEADVTVQVTEAPPAEA